jgi:DNA-binding response OmpR family regulator
VNDQRSVLIVDQSEENREVLRTVLERHGVRILTASRTKEGVSLAKQHRPDVIVLDTEFDSPDLGDFYCENSTNSEDSDSSVIFLGKVRYNTPGKSVSRGNFFAKPYQYGPLIRRIEEILENISRKVA